FVNSRDAACELVTRIEERGICVSDLLREREHFWRNGNAALSDIQVVDGGFGPHGPVAQEAAHDADASATKIERRHQVEQEVVIVSGVQRDLVGAAGIGDGAHDVDSLVAIEWRDFNRDYVFDFGELAPKLVRQNSSADAGLQIEAHHRNDVGDNACVVE